MGAIMIVTAVLIVPVMTARLLFISRCSLERKIEPPKPALNKWEKSLRELYKSEVPAKACRCCCPCSIEAGAL